MDNNDLVRVLDCLDNKISSTVTFWTSGKILNSGHAVNGKLSFEITRRSRKLLQKKI